MKKIIYADNAATTKLNIEAFEAMKPFLLEDFSNPSQPYLFSRGSKKAIKEARETIANCINAEPNEIYFTSGGTESDNWAIKCCNEECDDKIVITSSIEHHAVINACKSIDEFANVIYLPVNSKGVVDVTAFGGALNRNEDKSILVSIMLANNEIGTLQDIKALSEMAHKKKAIFHTDAVQAVGHIKIDVKELGVDMLSASAHKFNGPKGIGFLYIKKGTPITPLHNGGNQEFGMRSGTEDVASIVGMAKALEINCNKITENSNYIEMLDSRLMNELKSSGVYYERNGAQSRIPGNISLSFPGFEGEALLHRMDLMGICISTGSACDSINTQISHVLNAIGLNEKSAIGTIRISINADNTVEDVTAISKALIKIVS